MVFPVCVLNERGANTHRLFVQRFERVQIVKAQGERSHLIGPCSSESENLDWAGSEYMPVYIQTSLSKLNERTRHIG